MNQPPQRRQRPAHFIDLAELARAAMRERGLEPDFLPAVRKQVEQLDAPVFASQSGIRDLRDLLWVSIDNDDSRDLDQISVAEESSESGDRVWVAIADVDVLVPRNSPVDEHAQHNTTSVYTAARIFPMLPEQLSTDRTSLNENEDRLALVTVFTVQEDGTVGDFEIMRAWVRNKAKLAYNGVSAWLEERGFLPPAMAEVAQAPEQVRLQDQIAQRLRTRRDEAGALELETIEARAVVENGLVLDLEYEPQNRAQQLIEDFMIAVNGISARFLEQRKFPTLRRVVRSPERWDRLRELATQQHYSLPLDPDVRALAKFLLTRRRADPLRFPDLSLAVVKMLGSGEYVVQMPGEEPIGHFGLAVRDYSHSTAPNRRYPDLITQRLLKAALAGDPVPYSREELETLARHCTEQEDAANKVERQIRKSAAALLLQKRIGEQFDALVTGSSPKGVWARALHPPVEGKVVAGTKGLDVGDRLTVKLTGVNVERGFIDFVRV